MGTEQKKNNSVLITIIVLLSLLVVGLGGYFIYDKFIAKEETEEKDTPNNNDKPQTPDKEKTALGAISFQLKNKVDNGTGGTIYEGSLVSINDDEEVVTLVSYKKTLETIQQQDYDIYGDYLYYLNESYVYRIDLTKDTYTPEKLFKVEYNGELMVGANAIYVVGHIKAGGPYNLFEYSLENGTKKEIVANNLSYQVYLSKTTDQIFYTKYDKSLYVYDIKSKVETKLDNNLTIESGLGTMLYLRDLIANPINPSGKSYDYYSYDTVAKKKTKVDYIPYFSFNNSPIYAYDKQLFKLTNTGAKDILFEAENDINKFILLNDKALVGVCVSDNVQDSCASLNYSLVDLNTKKVANVKGKYNIEYYLEDYVHYNSK